LEAVLTEILEIDLGDRLEFQAHLMTSEDIREDTGYPCRRCTIPFQFGPRHARTIKLDVSMGDPITPGPKRFEVRSVLQDFRAEMVMGYPVETVLAEKVETVLARGLESLGPSVGMIPLLLKPDRVHRREVLGHGDPVVAAVLRHP
jgi:hypothetical protein